MIDHPTSRINQSFIHQGGLFFVLRSKVVDFYIDSLTTENKDVVIRRWSSIPSDHRDYRGPAKPQTRISSMVLCVSG